ncbi:unnamed protein product [Toxocara canis]|uniref:BPI2 domain-containing protein n=1 Tax=Toxocara canis TaxID=6265 RepID=A0A183TZW2_TOXCA|nr:unnamed protein product [Toxocara canis]
MGNPSSLANEGEIVTLGRSWLYTNGSAVSNDMLSLETLPRGGTCASRNEISLVVDTTLSFDSDGRIEVSDRLSPGALNEAELGCTLSFDMLVEEKHSLEIGPETVACATLAKDAKVAVDFTLSVDADVQVAVSITLSLDKEFEAELRGIIAVVTGIAMSGKLPPETEVKGVVSRLLSQDATGVMLSPGLVDKGAAVGPFSLETNTPSMHGTLSPEPDIKGNVTELSSLDAALVMCDTAALDTETESAISGTFSASTVAPLEADVEAVADAMGRRPRTLPSEAADVPLVFDSGDGGHSVLPLVARPDIGVSLLSET